MGIINRIGEVWRSHDNNNLPEVVGEVDTSTKNKNRIVWFKDPYFNRNFYMKVRKLTWIALDPIVITLESLARRMRKFVDGLYLKNVEEYMMNEIEVSKPSNPNDGLEVFQSWAHPKALKKYNRLKADGVNFRATSYNPNTPQNPNLDKLTDDIVNTIRQDNGPTKD